MTKKFIPQDYPIIFSAPLRIAPHYWAGHIPFAMFLVDILKPKVFVELGTYYGVSYCAFCQAVKELNLDTRCYALDTWQGDGITWSYDMNEVLEDLGKHHDPLYGAFSRLTRSTFDDALNSFEDEEIDLLHIDGFHPYESVKHDYETWLPKMSRRGVILFHDINVRQKDYGVWMLWNEVSQLYPHFEFFHEHGLGVLAVGSDVPASLKELLLEQDEISKMNIRRFFFEMGNTWKPLFDVAEAGKTQKEENGNYKVLFEKKQLELDAIRESRAYRLANTLRSALNIAVPPGSIRRKLAAKLFRVAINSGDVTNSLQSSKILSKQDSPTGGLWGQYSQQATALVSLCNFSRDDLILNTEVQTNNPQRLEIKRVLWFLPNVDYVFYGGLYTIFRFASYFSEKYNVENTFVILGEGNPDKLRSSLAETFPLLAGQNILYIQSDEQIKDLPPSDVCITTLWITAYLALKYNETHRKFYFLQDFEPLFYPAGSSYAQAEATYSFGFYGLANTISLKRIYEAEYGGVAEFYTPAVDKEVFYPKPNRKYSKDIHKIFFYGRPEHPRNAFELGIQALKLIKEYYGDRVEIVTAGSEWEPADFGLEKIIKNLGILPYTQTGDLYRECDLGLVMMLTRHPSYLPLELMACGCTVITNFNKYTSWLLKDNVNSFLFQPSINSIAETVKKAIDSPDSREKISQNAIQIIQQEHSSWASQIKKIYSFMQMAKE